MPLKTFPGIIKLAKSPEADTCKAPRTETSMCPPRIMAKDSAESKVEPPGTMVTVSLPALMMSASIVSSVGYAPCHTN